MTTRVCAGCLFFDKPQSDVLILDHIKGRCRRYPPVAVVPRSETDEDVPSSWFAWPQVDDEDYCGEWRA